MMEKVLKKPWVHLELKNVRCYCCIFKDKKVTYQVTKKNKGPSLTGSCSSLYNSYDDEMNEDKNVPVDHKDKTEDLQIYCCCYHLLKSFLNE